MLAKCASTKPLYKLERSIDYVKHKQKLRQINSKSPKSPSSRTNNSVEIRPWVKQKLKNEIEKNNKAIEEENQKLLSKLMKISTRNSLQIHEGVRHRENPYRKNWLKGIKRENEEFGEKLIHLRSSLEYSQFSKSIDEYEKVKKSMKVNRRARLPQLQLQMKPNESNYLRKILKTEPDSSMNHYESQRRMNETENGSKSKRELKADPQKEEPTSSLKV